METDTEGPIGGDPSFVRTFRTTLHKFRFVVYVALVLSSHLYQWSSDRKGTSEPEQADNKLALEQTYIDTTRTTIPAMGKGGPVGDAAIELSVIEWAPDNPFDRPPIILLHGSPGDATNFSMLGPVLAERGDSVLAIDLPGFGNSTAKVPSYSVRAAALSVIALMEARNIDRAHVVGWSNSGGVIINIAEIAPDRIATITLLAATGAQHTEGSGDYYFEHAKYALGYGFVVLFPELLPHFGVLGDFNSRRTFIRSFWDSDQRPLAAIMQRLETPALILQGRHDPLVADWAAEEHHRLMPTSRLVMLDASHFLPFLQADTTAKYLGEFFRRHDLPGVTPQTGAQILEPKRPGMFGQLGIRLARIPREQPWWLSAIGIAVVGLAFPRTAIAVAGLAAGLMHLDIGVALVGLVIGRSMRVRPERSIKAWLKLIVGTFFVLFLASVLTPIFARTGFDAIGTFGAIIAIATVLLALSFMRAGPLLFTWRGRCLLKARLVRTIRREFWPTWAMYLPILPHLIRLSIRHRSMLVFTACNPAIDNGGGFVGESKHNIMQGFNHAGEQALHSELLDKGRGSDQRAGDAISFIQSDEKLGGYPIVLKPNAGQRGEGVFIARSDEDVRNYFSSTKAPIVLQRFHPGPHECGILWCRNTVVASENSETPTGTILSITRKTFPQVRGDGIHTIEWLAYANQRFAPNAKAMLNLINDDPKRIPKVGQQIKLGNIGNHSLGTIFSDGADLITPELEKAIDELSAAFPHPDGGGLDVGRYDIRYKSEEALKRGEKFAIIEINGVTGESTNIYDPDKSLAWAIGVMKDHWSRMYALGAQRKASGHKPLSITRLAYLALTAR